MVAPEVPGFFQEVERAVPLVGPVAHLKRAISHHLIGALLRKVITFDDIFTDTRTNLMVAIQAGGGKREIEQTIRYFAQETDLRFEKPASRHEEQLIGQVRSVKDPLTKQWVARIEPGYLDLDLLLFNEAYGEINAPEQARFRAIICQGLDPINQNEISKKRLKDKTKLSYIPKVSITMLFQPQPIFAEVWFGGLPRRFLWTVMPELDSAQRKLLYEETTKVTMRPTFREGFLRHVAHILYSTEERLCGGPPKEMLFDWTSDTMKARLYQRWRELTELADERDKSLRKGGLSQTLAFNLRDHLVAMASHYCFARYFDSSPEGGDVAVDFGRMVVAHHDVDKAAMDLQRYVPDMIEFFSKWVNAELDLTRLSPERQAIVTCLARFGPQSIDALETNLGIAFSELFTSRRAPPNEWLQPHLTVLKVMGYIHENEHGLWEAGW